MFLVNKMVTVNINIYLILYISALEPKTHHQRGCL